MGCGLGVCCNKPATSDSLHISPMLLLNLLLHILLPQALLVRGFETDASIASIPRDLLLLKLLGWILLSTLRALERDGCGIQVDIKLLPLQRWQKVRVVGSSATRIMPLGRGSQFNMRHRGLLLLKVARRSKYVSRPNCHLL